MIQMVRHLRPVPTDPSGPTYVVGRTRLTEPGTAFVVAQCVDGAVAAVLALAGLETHPRHRMTEEPDLAEALRRWESHDHRTHERERSARAVVGGPPGQRRSAHPSVLAKLIP
jgi:hypothetical protein